MGSPHFFLGRVCTVSIRAIRVHIHIQSLRHPLTPALLLTPSTARRFPKVYHLDVSFRHRGESALVIEYLNKDLGKLFEEHRRKFSQKTTLMIAIQLLECLEQIHSANLLHCDLKPENCLIGRRSLNQESRLFMVDFGLSKEYRWPRDVKGEQNRHGAGKKGKAPIGGGKGKEDYEESMYEHIEDDGRRHSVRGTIRFISINSHKRRERSRRDEIESLSKLRCQVDNRHGTVYSQRLLVAR